MTTEKRIVAAWVEYAWGPEWSNCLVWYAYYQDGKICVDALQPEKQTAMMATLAPISHEMNQALVAEVENKLAKKRRTK